MTSTPPADARAGRSAPRTPRLAWLLVAALVALAVVVLAAIGLRALPAVQGFIERFPGASALPSFAPVGFPAWLAWQHGLNAFFMLFVIRTGLQLRIPGRPTTFWTRRNTGVLATAGDPVRITLATWFHIAIDVLWAANGVLFYVLIFVTAQWTRIVPTRWDVIPNAVSSALQYASLDWPGYDGWANYNALQLLSYFLVVFVAAPLALITGIRMSPGLATRLRPLDRVFPMRATRTIHFATMVFFVLFIIVHVTLVLATGAVRNLDHMYAARDDGSWVGFAIFAASVVVMVIAWFALRPPVVARLAALTGDVRTRR
jgi:thiosulfate reductase cytochrome b subunit